MCLLHENSILTPLQYGFIHGDSTTNQLNFLYGLVSHALDSGYETNKRYSVI